MNENGVSFHSLTLVSPFHTTETKASFSNAIKSKTATSGSLVPEQKGKVQNSSPSMSINI